MSGGGGSAPTHTTSQVTQSNLPEYARPYYQSLLGRAGYESAVPYSPYPAQRLAYFSPQEQEAMNRMEAMGVSGTTPELDASSMISGQVGMGNPYASSMIGATQRAQPFATMADPYIMGQYMNPYQQLVTDVEKREAKRQSDIMGADIGLKAAAAGSLGGYREGIMQSERERNLAQQMGDIQMRGSQQAFDQARGAYEADRAARQRAAELSQQAYGNLLQGDQQRLAAAGVLGETAAQRQAMEIERLKGLQAAGEIQRQLYQRGLDIGYADFLRQQAYPKEQLAFYSSMLQGLPIRPGEIQTSYGVGPSTTQQLLGTGIAGVGLYNALRGQQGGMA